MFKKNTKHLQPALISAASELPEKQLKLLKGSWAHSFYHEFFCRMDEEIFANLYSIGDFTAKRVQDPPQNRGSLI